MANVSLFDALDFDDLAIGIYFFDIGVQKSDHCDNLILIVLVSSYQYYCPDMMNETLHIDYQISLDETGHSNYENDIDLYNPCRAAESWSYLLRHSFDLDVGQNLFLVLRLFSGIFHD
jgi:hypothetical protein